MKKNAIILFCATILFLAPGCNNDTKHNISVRIKSPNDTLIVFTEGLYDRRIDTVRSVKGEFVYDLPETMEGPAEIFMIPLPDLNAGVRNKRQLPLSKTISLILTIKDHVRVKSRPTEIGMEYKVTGSALNETMAAHHTTILPLLYEIDNIREESDKARMNPISNENDNYISALTDDLSEGWKEMVIFRKNFIRRNPSADLSAAYLSYIEPDSVRSYLSMLTPAVTEGTLKPWIERYVRFADEEMASRKRKEDRFVGNEAPDFFLEDRYGKRFSLADIDKEYIILDFWGSWCKGCIADFPKMRECYARFKDRIEIIGIASDMRDNWLAALDKHETAWLQLLDNPEDSTSGKYTISTYPTKIIIGPDRKITAVFSGNPGFYQRLEELLM